MTAISTSTTGSTADDPQPGTDEWVEANEDWLSNLAASAHPDAWVAANLLETYESSEDDDEDEAGREAEDDK